MRQEDHLEERFIPIKVNIPSISAADSKTFKCWLGDLCKKVFSRGFQLFESGKLTEKKAKVFCCENLLYNIVEVVRKNKFNAQDVKSMNKSLEEQLGYLLLKYPQSEEAEMSMSLAGIITEVDNITNDNDLVWRSGITF